MTKISAAVPEARTVNDFVAEAFTIVVVALSAVLGVITFAATV